MEYRIEKATLADVETLYQIINKTAQEAVLLVRSRNYLFENIRDFWVVRIKNTIVGCGSLHIVGWEDLAEVKSLAVLKQYQRHGLGKLIIDHCLAEARGLGVKKVFALTYAPGFFKKMGFKLTNKKLLPHKIWAECINCDKFPDCKEEAMILSLNKRGGTHG